jgi:DMSO reductase anchor subunit
VQQKAMGFLGGSFNTREFFHGASAERFNLVRNAFLLLTFPLPVLLVSGPILGWGGRELVVAALLVKYLGLLAERWYFFAEARHPQNIYYRTMA